MIPLGIAKPSENFLTGAIRGPPVRRKFKNINLLVSNTVLSRPTVQSYVMMGHELNKFGTCHGSFGLMNINENKLKLKNFPNFAYIWAILLN